MLVLAAVILIFPCARYCRDVRIKTCVPEVDRRCQCVYLIPVKHGLTHVNYCVSGIARRGASVVSQNDPGSVNLVTNHEAPASLIKAEVQRMPFL